MWCEARCDVVPSLLGLAVCSRSALGLVGEPVGNCRLALSLHVSFEKNLLMYRRWTEVGMLSPVHGRGVVHLCVCVCVRVPVYLWQSPGSSLWPASQPLLRSQGDLSNPFIDFPRFEQRPETCCFPSCLSPSPPPSEPLPLTPFLDTAVVPVHTVIV